MEKFVIKGGRELHGRVEVSGSKNASLPILFASILTGELDLSNVPALMDVATTCDLLEHMGFSVSREPGRIRVKERKLLPRLLTSL